MRHVIHHSKGFLMENTIVKIFKQEIETLTPYDVIIIIKQKIKKYQMWHFIHHSKELL